jgi:hypothetical protein
VHSAENGTSTRQGIPFPPSLLRSDQNCIFICCIFLGFSIHVSGSVEHTRTLSQQNEVKIYKFAPHALPAVSPVSALSAKVVAAGKDCRASFPSSFFTRCNNRKCIRPRALHVLTRKDWALKAYVRSGADGKRYFRSSVKCSQGMRVPFPNINFC